MAVAKRYQRDGVIGVGYECTRAGMQVHVIAWENGEVDRFRDGSDNMLEVDVEDLPGELSNTVDPPVIKQAKPSESQPSGEGSQSNGDQQPSWAPTPGDSEAASIRSYLTLHGLEVENKQVVDALAVHGIAVNSSQVTAAKKTLQKG